MSTQPVPVPDLGSFKDVAVIDLLVAPGDRVEVDTPLLTLETEKATMDVPAPFAGVVEKWRVAKGDKVNAGDVLLMVRADAAPVVVAPAAKSVAAAAAHAPVPGVTTAPDGSAAAAPNYAVPAQAAPAVSNLPGARGDLPFIDEPGFSRAHASPSVRLLARELGVDLSRVAGSGLKGRISHADVKAYVKRSLQSVGAPTVVATGPALPTVPPVDFAAFGPVEVKPLGRIQKISGPRLHASWVNLPHVTQFDEADITELEELRLANKGRAAKEGVKLTPLAFIVRACVKALAQFPVVNSSLDASQSNLVLKKYCNIGFAADTPQGLLVPVIHNADKMDLFAIARALATLSEKARGGKLSGAEMQGGSFTISSLGGIGGTAFTPIINAPEVAILGVSRATRKLVWQYDAFQPRLMLPLSLSYDHRVVDGALGARFTTALAAALADPQSLLAPLA
jgi:pyruvate dehydrogenase E2 component (dihydrolipoamide acetyltransferase)